MKKIIDLTPLKKYLGDRLITGVDKYPEYAKDASELNASPSAIIFAETDQEIIEISKICSRYKIPITFRGAGTGYTGGAVPINNAVVVSLEKLANLLIEPEKQMARCGPGVITKDLMDEAQMHDLFYPPDPASYDECSLGGNIAENAGGLHCKKYGVTKDYVIGLKAVTIKGEILKTGIYAKDELFDLTSILIGSEGILAAITEIAVRLIKQPQTGPTILTAFDDPEMAAATVAEVIMRGLVPSVMEYIDGDATAASNAYEESLKIDQAGAILLFETTGQRAFEEADMIETICRHNQCSLLERQDDHIKAENLWKIRRNLSKAVKASAVQKISEDVCVPPSKLPNLVAYVADLNKKLPLRVNSYGHAGDGNLHVNFLTESGSPDYQSMIDENIIKLFRKTISLGGTLTGEHGIGLTKKDHLGLEFDQDTIESMKKIKLAFDNKGLLNPGKMFV